MEKIRLTMFVTPMGNHDVNRVSALMTKWLTRTQAFTVTVAGECARAVCGIDEFMLDMRAVAHTDMFMFVCSDDFWKNPASRTALEAAVSGGKGIMFTHGLHPCFGDWPEMEKMIGLLWRETGFHGDFNDCDISIEESEHPIIRGITGFHTREELFCGLTNVHNVPLNVLATGYSDAKLVSRWGMHGTGRQEPVLTTGSYGSGRTLDFLLGHVWTYYTGHGLLENTTIALEPEQVKSLFLRSCEWVATGDVNRTLGF